MQCELKPITYQFAVLTEDGEDICNMLGVSNLNAKKGIEIIFKNGTKRNLNIGDYLVQSSHNGFEILNKKDFHNKFNVI